MQLNLGHSNQYLTAVETTVSRRGRSGDAWLIAASPSIYYPGGGGQPPDEGRIGDARILSTSEGEGGETVYHVDRELAEGPALMTIEETRRRDHMEQHTAQHLLSHLFESSFGAATLSFHMKDGELILDRPCPDSHLREVEAAANAAIRDGRNVTVSVHDAPDGPHREIEIAGVGRAPCGGTHVRTVAELRMVVLKSKKPDVIHFLAGTRALRGLQDRVAQESELTRLLSAPPAEHLRAIERTVDNLAAAKKSADEVRRDAGAAIARLISQSRGRLVWELDFADAALLRSTGSALREQDPGRVALLTSAAPNGSLSWLVAAPAADANRLGAEVARILGGRGGGKHGVFFGVAPAGGSLAAATEFLRKAVHEVETPATASCGRSSR